MNQKEILALPAVQAAPLLLGWRLCRHAPSGLIKVKIVETEAYHQNDPASHSYRGQTDRTKPMFQPGGRLYVYFTYGMHYCLNIVVGKKGAGEAVLIRAAEPLEGIEIMQRNRGVEGIKNLASGPGKLTQAFGIKDTKLSGKILNKSSVFLQPPESPVKPADVVARPRIGISEAAKQPWRFYIKGNAFVSKP